MNIRLAALTLAFLVIAGSSVPHASSAQTVPDPNQPRVNEVDQRLQNQQNRVNSGTAADQLNGGQAARDTTRDTRISNELSRDQAANGGHITRAQRAKMNRQLNRNSHHIHRQRKLGTAPAATAPTH